MKKIIVAVIMFFTISCTGTRYLEKESEALSQAVYGTRDSLDVARLDLADMYSAQSARIVVPPKNRIKIEPVYKKESVNTKGQRVLIVPEKYKHDKVIIVNSDEYNELLKTAEINAQLSKDNDNLKKHITDVDKQLMNQQQVSNELILKNNELQENVLKKDKIISDKNGIIFKLWTGLISICIGIGIYTYLKFRTRLPW